MNDPFIELSPEQAQALRESLEKLIQAARKAVDVLIECFQMIMEKLKEIAINLARFFLKLQLLEWKLPYPLADLISRNASWYWAARLGGNWLERKMQLLE